MLVSRCCTRSGHGTPEGIGGLGNRIVSDAELSRQQEDVGTQKKSTTGTSVLPLNGTLY